MKLIRILACWLWRRLRILEPWLHLETRMCCRDFWNKNCMDLNLELRKRDIYQGLLSEFLNLSYLLLMLLFSMWELSFIVIVDCHHLICLLLCLQSFLQLNLQVFFLKKIFFLIFNIIFLNKYIKVIILNLWLISDKLKMQQLIYFKL